jgi:hypothetical protein
MNVGDYGTAYVAGKYWYACKILGVDRNDAIVLQLTQRVISHVPLSTVYPVGHHNSMMCISGQIEMFERGLK